MEQRVADSPYTRVIAWLGKVPLGWKVLGIFLASGLLWVLILWAVSLIASGAECKNSQVTAANLPPKQYRHEPRMPYQFISAELLAAMNKHDWTVGYYGKTTGVVFVCAGLTGKALRIVRMHEEAHALYGWRH